MLQFAPEHAPVHPEEPLQSPQMRPLAHVPLNGSLEKALFVTEDPVDKTEADGKRSKDRCHHTQEGFYGRLGGRRPYHVVP